MIRIFSPLVLSGLFFCQCSSTKNATLPVQKQTSHYVKKISYNGISVDVVIDDPGNNSPDVILAYHGTVMSDSRILQAAETALEKVKAITGRKDIMIISVAYPEEGLMMGDNIKECEAALLWVKNRADGELNISIKKIFLIGHSQGGYIVTRLNTMHETNGVIANGPGPLNLELRCQLEEDNKAPRSEVCRLLKNTYGAVEEKPQPYLEKSLLNFTANYKSDILFVQGMQDSRIQLTSWPKFKEKINSCSSCKKTEFLELAGYGHAALFESEQAKKVYNDFINR